MILELCYLHEGGLRIAAADDEPGIRELLFEDWVELVAVPVSLGDLHRSIGPHGVCTRGDSAPVCAEPHGATLLCDAPLLGQKVDYRRRGLGVEFRAVRPFQVADASRVLHHGELHPEADAEEGDLVSPGMIHGTDLSLDAALSEPAWYEYAVDIGEVR